jgi:hypothetical protein
MRDAAGRGWLVTGAAPRRAAALDPAGSTVAGGLALSVTGGAGTTPGTAPGGPSGATPGTAPGGPSGAGPGTAVVARSPETGAQVWRWAAPPGDTVTVLAAQPGAVHLLTGGRELVTVDPATGVPRSRFVLNRPKDSPAWTAGAVQAGTGFVAVERLRTPPDPAAEDVDYYYSASTVIIAAT